MNEEFYSIGRGSLNINGKFYCGLDYKITDFMRSLEEENKKLKEQYCERTDCSGRLVNSKKVEELEQENKILKENAEHNDKVVDKVNWENQLLKKENQKLKEQLQQKEDIINKIREVLLKDFKEKYI